MSILSGKKVLLGVTGGIAAYKTPLIVRLLIKQGAEVKVVMTPSATDFVTPLTLSTLSQTPVVSTFTAEGEGDHPNWNNHVELALWADLMLIAPATSNTISSMVNARCNNLLLACYLSAQCHGNLEQTTKHGTTVLLFFGPNASGHAPFVNRDESSRRNPFVHYLQDVPTPSMKKCKVRSHQ